MKIKNMRRMIAPLFVVFAMAGCTSVRVASDIEARQVAPVAEKMPRSKRIFLYQSRVANEIFDRYPSLDSLEGAGMCRKEKCAVSNAPSME